MHFIVIVLCTFVDYDKSMRNILHLLCISIVVLFATGCSDQDITVYNEHFLDMWAQSLKPYSVDIAFYGDSRVVLADWEEAFDDSSVVNLGIGGDIVEGTIQRLRLLEALDVKYCFVAIGVNNCSKESFSYSDFKEKYEILLDGLEDLGITVYVNTIAGVTTANSSFGHSFVQKMTDNITEANTIIRELATERSVTLIDMAALMNNTDNTLKDQYSADGIHFTASGNQLWFDTIRPYIQDLSD